MSIVRKKILGAILIFAFCLPLSLALKSSDVFIGIQEILQRNLYFERAAHPDILLVGIDEKTLQDKEFGGLGRMSDWTREYYAIAIEKLRSAGAKSIFLDFNFGQTSAGISLNEVANLVLDSENFAEVGEKVAAYLSGHHPMDLVLQAAMGPDVFLLKYTTNPSFEDGEWRAGDIYEAIPIFKNAADSAFSNAVETGSYIDRLPVGFWHNGSFEESLAARISRHFLYGSSDFFHPNQGFTMQEKGETFYLFDEERKIPLEKGQMLINYSGPSGSYPMISFADLVKGSVPGDLVRDKIILIGASAAILQDRHKTPIDSKIPMSGIEIQANAIQSVLENNFLSFETQKSFIFRISLFSIIILGGVLFLAPVFGISVFAIIFGLYPFFAKWSFHNGEIIDLVYGPLIFLLVFLLSFSLKYFFEFRQKKLIKKAFARYLSPSLVKEISEHPESLHLGGERRELSILFLDIAHFSTLSENLDAKSLVLLMNRIFEALSKAIVASGGMVDKFEGDSIMALFGAPLAKKDHAKMACEAALAVQKAMQNLNNELKTSISLRIGLAAGEAVLGNIGSEERFQYTAMGDIVNTASRLESLNKKYGTEILVNEGIKTQCAEVYFRFIDKISPAGKNEILNIWAPEFHEETGEEINEENHKLWKEIVSHYQAQNWALAVPPLQKFISKNPNDGPAKIYMERLLEFQKSAPLNPDGSKWDGVWRWMQK